MMSVFVTLQKKLSFHVLRIIAVVLSLGVVLTGCSSQLKYDPRSVDKTNNASVEAAPKQASKPCSTVYVVKAGDTLSGISRSCRLDMSRIAQANDLLPPYIIYVNQELDIPYPEMVINSQEDSTVIASKVEVTENNKDSSRAGVSLNSSSKQVENQTFSESQSKNITEVNPEFIVENANKESNTEPAAGSDNNSKTAQALDKQEKQPPYKNVKWQWPMHKGLAYKYRRDRAGLSVLEIYGLPGQDINAVAPGKVVYAGNGIANYGWMVVIKHAEDYMSIYAHNSSLLVTEGDSVEAGEKIALLGATGNTKRPKLYLEARYQGRKYDIKKKLKY